MKKIKEIIIATLIISTYLTACGNAQADDNNEPLYDNYEVYSKSTHTDRYEQIGSNTTEKIPEIIISDELKNWVEPEDNGVEAWTYYQSMKDSLGVTEIHSDSHYTEVSILSDELALQAMTILGDYGNKYAHSALYEKAKEVDADYIDIMEFKDMGDGTYVVYIDFGTAEADLYISDTEAFIK